MKTMYCHQLGGPPNCNVAFTATTFEEVAQLSHAHGTEMFAQQDEDHLKAMELMQILMQKPGDMKKWMQEREAEFEAVAEDVE